MPGSELGRAEVADKRRSRSAVVPSSAPWEEIAKTLPEAGTPEWSAFKDLVLNADMVGELKPM
jgi:hypothetical protein